MMTEQELHELVKQFNVNARPTGEASEPATVTDIDNLVSQTAHVLDQIISALSKN